LSICAAMPGALKRAGKRSNKDEDTKRKYPGGRIGHQVIACGKSTTQRDASVVAKPTLPYIIEESVQKEKRLRLYFKGRGYDVGDKQGFLEAIVEYTLRREDLCEGYLTT